MPCSRASSRDATAAVEPKWFTIAPVHALAKLYAKTGTKPLDWDLYEINEAFSGVTMAAAKEHGIPLETRERARRRGRARSPDRLLRRARARDAAPRAEAIAARDAASRRSASAAAKRSRSRWSWSDEDARRCLGTGTMGAGIAQVAAQAGFQVIFRNRKQDVGRQGARDDQEVARPAARRRRRSRRPTTTPRSDASAARRRSRS